MKKTIIFIIISLFLFTGCEEERSFIVKNVSIKDAYRAVKNAAILKGHEITHEDSRLEVLQIYFGQTIKNPSTTTTTTTSTEEKEIDKHKEYPDEPHDNRDKEKHNNNNYAEKSAYEQTQTNEVSTTTSSPPIIKEHRAGFEFIKEGHDVKVNVYWNGDYNSRVYALDILKTLQQKYTVIKASSGEQL